MGINMLGDSFCIYICFVYEAYGYRVIILAIIYHYYILYIYIDKIVFTGAYTHMCSMRLGK